MADVNITGLSHKARIALENALANARLEGHDVPAELQELAVAYANGEIDRDGFYRLADAFSARLAPTRHPS